MAEPDDGGLEDAGTTQDAGATQDGGSLGDGGTDGGLDAGVPDAGAPIVMTAVTPGAISRLIATNVTVSGSGVVAGANVDLLPCDAGAASYSFVGTVLPDGGGVEVAVAADSTRAIGTYSVSVTNPDGGNASLSCALKILGVAPPTISSLSPTLVWRGTGSDAVVSDPVVDLSGTGFQPGTVIRFVAASGGAIFESPLVRFFGANALSAVVPVESLNMAAGGYVVTATSEEGLAAQSSTQLLVTATPPPMVASVTPQQLFSGSCVTTDVTISGANFSASATASYSKLDGTVSCASGVVEADGRTWCPFSSISVTGDGGVLTGRFPSCFAGYYSVAVKNPDGQRDSFDAIRINGSSDPLNDGQPFSVLSSSLVTPRYRHGAVEGFDDFGNSYLYVVGGVAASSTVLDTVEMARVSPDGTLGTFALAQQYGSSTSPRATNRLVAARQGGALVRDRQHLYYVGGAALATDTTTSIPSSAMLMRSRMLGRAEQPKVSKPTAAAGGSLPTGTWYYQVSALGPWGEGLASPEVVIQSAGGKITVCWLPPPIHSAEPATGYNVYRSSGVSGSGSATLLATNVAGPCFVDDGTASSTSTIRPLPLGSLSKWSDTGIAMQAPREGTDAVVVRLNDPNPGTPGDVVARIIVVGGRVENTMTASYLNTAESIGITESGTLESAWSTEGCSLLEARVYHALRSTQDRSAVPFASVPAATFERPTANPSIAFSEGTYLVAVQGDKDYVASLNQGLSTLEAVELASTGRMSCASTGRWTSQQDTEQTQTFAGDAFLGVTSLYPFLALARESVNVSPPTRTHVTSAQGFFPLKLDPQGTLPTSSASVLNNRNSAAISLTVRRSYYQLVRLNGFVYVVGGWSDTPAGPTGLIEQHRE